MVPLARPARSVGWGSTRDTLYLKSLEFRCDASSCDDTRVPVFMRQDRTQTRESSLTCIPALLSSSDPEVFFTHSLPTPGQDLLGRAGWLERPSTARWGRSSGLLRPAPSTSPVRLEAWCFPGWDTTTAALPPPRPDPERRDARTDSLGPSMPTRRRTHAQQRHQSIKAERALNDPLVAERNRPTPPLSATPPDIRRGHGISDAAVQRGLSGTSVPNVDDPGSGRLFRDGIQFCSGLVDLVVRVVRHGGGGHRLTLAGERLVGRLTEHTAEVSNRGAELCQDGKCGERA
jgi:hypothetical protein